MIDIVQIYKDKDVDFFNKDLIDIALKTVWSIGESKKHDLILNIAVSSPKSSFLFINFSNSYLLVGIGQV